MSLQRFCKWQIGWWSPRSVGNASTFRFSGSTGTPTLLPPTSLHPSNRTCRSKIINNKLPQALAPTLFKQPIIYLNLPNHPWTSSNRHISSVERVSGNSLKTEWRGLKNFLRLFIRADWSAPLATSYSYRFSLLCFQNSKLRKNSATLLTALGCPGLCSCSIRNTNQ